MTTVINHTRRGPDPLPGEYVYIGRPSKWGNPFRIGVHGTREQVIAKYREWFYASDQAQLRADALMELKDKVLGCYCKPLDCHGDIIADFVNRSYAER